MNTTVNLLVGLAMGLNLIALGSGRLPMQEGSHGAEASSTPVRPSHQRASAAISCPSSQRASAATAVVGADCRV